MNTFQEEQISIRKPHPEGCKCTYCDEESQMIFKSMFHAQSDFLGTIVPEVHTFEDQKPEDAEALLAKEKEDIEAFLKKLKERPELKANFDSLDKDKQYVEIHSFVNQSVDEVKELIRLSCEQSIEAQKKMDEPCEEPVLCGGWMDNHPEGHKVDIRASFRDRCKGDFFDMDLSPEIIKLAGLAPDDELVPNEPVMDQMMDALIKSIKEKHNSLNVEWSDDCWDKRLIVNGAMTKIRYQKMRLAYEGLKNVTGKQEAADIVRRLILKKLRSLFI